MSDSFDQIFRELKALGREPTSFDSPQGRVAAFNYRIEVGRHRGKTVTLGVSLQGAEQYPEYPPHWLHLTPPIDDLKGGAIVRYTDDEGRQWIAMSRPPGPLWDRLPTKHMSTFLSEHVRRFWKNI